MTSIRDVPLHNVLVITKTSFLEIHAIVSHVMTQAAGFKIEQDRVACVRGAHRSFLLLEHGVHVG